MNEKSIFVIFALMLIVGIVLEYILEKTHLLVFKKKHKTHYFPVSKFLYFLIFPLISILFVASQLQIPIILGFLIFSIVGTTAEYFLGYSFYQIVGRKLWTYHTYPIGGYTSWLSVPLWGVGGIIFWLISRLII
ncbi:hypothetical protein HY085_01135 [Candidatus Gottesmanbacteria bacterium]|nr:hypothetical protein [Candidatus Gottesmanbacteria bacterium]